ncbi:hypothetical protein QQF64_003290 [Cirrhinus molitorella]|uniref:Integrase catalytic domain-containing protein n=1 Tax=Cirrhinus molitorella TaxID=172907 RepID=A0ABR3MKZ1_9TELE
MDLIGKLMTTESGYQYICVLVDYFTNWPEAYQLKSKSAADATEGTVSHEKVEAMVEKEVLSDGLIQHKKWNLSKSTFRKDRKREKDCKREMERGHDDHFVVGDKRQEC